MSQGEYMTTGEASKLTGLHAETLRRAVIRGELRSVNRFGYHALKRSDVIRFHENHRGRRLSRKDVVEIKWMLTCGVLQKDIARLYHVSRSTISAIKRGETWAKVSE